MQRAPVQPLTIEARLNLVPSTIYSRSAGVAPAPAIQALHLGIAVTTDVDAFELVWLPVPANGQQAIALLYSVDPDDPATAIDESGGGRPNTIYASFLNGSSFVLVDGDDNQFDDIDALATRIPSEDSDGDGVPDTNDNCIDVWNPVRLIPMAMALATCAMRIWTTMATSMSLIWACFAR